MNKTLLIFRHEFLRTIRRGGFIALTLALPVLALIGIGVANAVSGMTKPEPQVTKIGYVDELGGFSQFTTQGNIEFVGFNTADEAKSALLRKDIKEYFVISPDFITTGIIHTFTTTAQIAPAQATIDAIQHFTTINLLNNKVSPDVIARVEGSVNLVTTKLTSTGEIAPQQGGLISFIVPGVFGFLLALSLIMSSAYVLQSLSEEKENRLMEIMMSSVSTRQLLAGKVLGLGAAGLVQVMVWVISLPLLLNLASSSIGGLLATIHVSAAFWILGIVYFILGYAMFAVISACIAAISSTMQEAQGIAGIYTIFNFAPFWGISLLMFYPNHPAWIVLSIFPLTAPVVTLMRFGSVGVPVWQLIVSMLVMALCIFGVLLLASKLLRSYMLMYGKRPKLNEIIRSFKAG
ncbi:MAG TPA: ABC transporter permease [Dehalococcoidales bacterium]|nr:ABC transporter permease [Dehalococcoidales bacterium]